MLWISLKFGDTCLLGGDFVQDQASSIVCTGGVCVYIYIEYNVYNGASGISGSILESIH